MSWNAEVNYVSCSLVDKTVVVLSLRTQHKVKLLMEEYPSREWLGYLVGQISKGVIFAKDLVIPVHAISSAGMAESEVFSTPKETVGVIHSHHSMGAFHSGTDAAHVDTNYPCSITVAKRAGSLEFSTVGLMVTPCGKPSKGTISLLLQQWEPDFKVEDWLAEAKESIDQGVKITVYAGTGKYPIDWTDYLHKYGGDYSFEEEKCNWKRMEDKELKKLKKRSHHGQGNSATGV